jgi:hypothetical protein
MHEHSRLVFLSVLTMLTSITLCAQSNVAPAKDSATAVQYANAAETDPLTETARLERKEAMAFAENDHQTHILLCQQIFQQMNSNRGANAHEISLQYLISAAGFLYVHPEAVADSTAQNVAGVEAALNVYEKFLASDPKSRSKFLDSLAKQRDSGKLKDYIVQL